MARRRNNADGDRTAALDRGGGRFQGFQKTRAATSGGKKGVSEDESSDERPKKGGAVDFPPSSTQATGDDDDRSREPKFGFSVSLQRSDLLCLLRSIRSGAGPTSRSYGLQIKNRDQICNSS
ncbi:hypothetical protein MRB53_013116 [Persea americana]|uniref:Uncharacterized protein n=1 Tax=Persea americana TaxID=3435 RepID=A0ACC2K730_PERAE|nr:hypothetical protein MRB53_013116 [Persea americana]